MNTLKEIFTEIGNHTGVDIGCNDKDGIHTYLETYDKLFAQFQNNFASILEIGLASGDSITLWNKYFKKCRIVGCDLSIIFNQPEPENGNTIELIASDATKPEFVKALGDKRFDIVIDDGSHLTDDQITTFNLLKGRMNKGGIYIIEDILALDQERRRFERLHSNCEIIDMRSNGRFDNVLIIYRF